MALAALILASGLLFPSQLEPRLGADMHAHPSRFHRPNLSRIEAEEIARYRRAGIDVVVCNISTDTPYRGGYVLRDGTDIATGQRRPEPGEPWSYTLDRLERILDTVEAGELHRIGVGLVQLVHFRANEIGHIQTWPYTPGGLTAFGREVVREANRLGMVIDLAHANSIPGTTFPRLWEATSCACGGR